MAGNNDRIPPAFAGAVDLGPQAMPMPRTHHETVFKSCRASLECVTDVDDIVRGYQFHIQDVLENHDYIFPFDEEMLRHLSSRMEEAPGIGFSVKIEGE